MPQPKEWTIMFYFGSDNPLAPSIVSQLKAIKDAGFHPEANVVARYDPQTEQTPNHIFDVNHVAKLRYPNHSRVGFANDPYVRNLVLDKLWGNDDPADQDIRERIKEALGKSRNGNGNGNGRGGQGAAAEGVEVDMPVLPKTFARERPPRKALKDFLDFCAKEYPARRYMLFILGHGVIVGNDFFLFDEHVDDDDDATDDGIVAKPDPKLDAKGGKGSATKAADREKERSKNALSLKGLGWVLRDFRKTIKKTSGEESEFELLGFHSCSMSGLEVAYELRDTANYLLASQGPAFVGMWPYRQLLMRVFNDLNSPLLSVGDLEDGRLAARLRAGGDAAAEFLRGKLSKETRGLLAGHGNGDRPGLELVRALAGDLNGAIKDGSLLKSEAFPAQAAPRQPGARHRARAKLAGAFPDEVAADRRVHPRDVKDMMTRLFYYILYNSYDYQLAGYSFDLCLSDLRRVGDVGDAVRRLSAALREALAGGPGLEGGDRATLGRELILLSHWDAQSFWQESYTDLYDFCFRLKRRCLHLFPELRALDEGADEDGKMPTGVMADVVLACGKVIEGLKRGEEGDDDRAVVRADFAGAEYQYSHGFSVFFPWAKPIGSFFEDTYKGEYEFARETEWGDFLEDYFKKTRRETHGDEKAATAQATTPQTGVRPTAVEQDDPDGDVERVVLEKLLVAVGNRVFSEGQLDGPGHIKGGPDDPLGPGPKPVKGGPDDPLGLTIVAATLKNYPFFTGKSPEDEPEQPEEEGYPAERLKSQPYSSTFFQGLASES